MKPERSGSIDPAKPPRSRLGSVDAYRGLAMLLMVAEALRLAEVAKAHPESPTWTWLGYHQSHVDWSGCSIHDLIQPSFTFLVGVSLALSMANRRGSGRSPIRLIAGAAWRGLVLVGLGIGLRSVGEVRTNFTFEDTLTQIGLGYLPLFLLARRGRMVQALAFGLILVATWAAFVVYEGPPPRLDGSRPGVGLAWLHDASGLASHWDKNRNLAWRFDRGFLNRFPRESEFRGNGGGYATLSAVPTLATMILGLLAGSGLVGAGGGRRTAARLSGAGLGCIAMGLALDRLGVCPIVKRVWSPAWVLYSGGICLMVLAGFHGIVDLAGWRAWTFPLAVVGRNSIAAYVLAERLGDFIAGTCQTHLGQGVFAWWGDGYESIVRGSAVVVGFWLILYWMDRRRIYLKV